MQLRVLALLLLLLCMCPVLAQGSYENCCLKYGSEPKARFKKKVVSYRIQESDGGCNIPAVISVLVVNNSLKTYVFILHLNWVSVSEPRTLSGRLFQSLGAKCENVLPPLVDFALLGTTRSPEF
ncbi:chemokine CCL-C11a precursor [Silurus meridionalis]|nr:chemokine CCL-C11a precursor [Silurus meridionalis]